MLDPVEETSVVVPARSLHELSRVLSDTDDPVDIVLSPSRNQILFHLEGIDLVSRLIDGQFPNYQQVLPKGFTTKATVDRDQLLKAVRLASLIASSSANIVKLQVGKDAEIGLTVSAAADVGDNRSEVEATVEGDGTTIAFNARYLLDVLTNVDAEQFSHRAERAPFAGRLPAGRRRAVRPRRHAGQDDLVGSTADPPKPDPVRAPTADRRRSFAL